MLRGVKGKLFREPRGGYWPWAWLLIGCTNIVVGLFFYSSREAQLPSLFFVVSGLMFVFGGVAESLVQDRTTLAAWLRVGFYTASICSMILLIVNLSSRAY